MTTPKAYYKPTSCRCHPETCACNPWTVFDSGGNKCGTHYFEEDAQKHVEALNKRAELMAENARLVKRVIKLIELVEQSKQV